MKPLRIIYSDLPKFLEIPEFLHHKKVEVILWPLEEVSNIIENDLILSLFGSIPDFPEIERLNFEQREAFI